MFDRRPVALIGSAALFAVLAAAQPAWATVYTDRAAFMTALGSLAAAAGTENYESRPLGPIGNGQTLGAFSYAFDPTMTQPAVATDGKGGRALGGAPNDVFVGGDAVDLHLNGVRPLLAFGADYAYAPSFLPAPASIYRLSVQDGTAAGTIAYNGPNLDPNGGTFFLGIVEPAAAGFRGVRLYSVVPTDANGTPFFLDAAYQIDNLVFAAAAAVPEPGTAGLLLLGLGVATRIRRQKPSASSFPNPSDPRST